MYDGTMTYHAIELDFRNELGQQVMVITCPVAKTTYAIINGDACNCGKKF
jgi:hypothetical protein